MGHQWRLALALMTAAVFAACGGGGGGGSTAVPAAPANGALTPNAVTLAIKIPLPPNTSASSRNAKYISPGTQSIGVVVTPQGLTPSPAQYVNVSQCPSVAGVQTCTITVTANYGSDTFTITAYSGTNGTGSVLSTGSTVQTITAGAAPPTISVTMGGVVSTIAITALNANLPLSQSMSVNVAEKDASGATFIGTFPTPVSLVGTNLVVSPASLPDSTTASNVTVSWTQGYLGAATSSLTGTAGTATGSLTVNPASGFAYYTTGNDAVHDWDAFKIIVGGDGNLFYSTIGPTTCDPTTGVCYASAGGLHQFNPATQVDNEIKVSSEPAGLTYAPDGSVWFGGGRSPAPSASPLAYRVPSTNWTSGGLTQIAVPGTSAGSNPFVRTAAADNSGHIWFADLGSNRYMSIPVAGPYTTASFTVYPMPSPPAGASTIGGRRARTVNFANGYIAYGFPGGFVNVVNPSTGAVVGQYVENLQTSLGVNSEANTYDSATDGTTVYYGQIGDPFAAYSVGDLESFALPAGPFTTLTTVSALSTTPIVPSVGNGYVYYADYAQTGIGVSILATGHARLYPIGNATTGFFYGPNGMAALSDGTTWFSCYGNSSLPTPGEVYVPICLGHTTYVSTWGLWPGLSVGISGAGPAGAQVVGIMEAPSADSGPFTTATSNAAVCTASTPAGTSDHNFTITGVSAGGCTVTVSDAHGLSQAISVVVTTTSGTVQSRRGGVQL